MRGVNQEQARKTGSLCKQLLGRGKAEKVFIAFNQNFEELIYTKYAQIKSIRGQMKKFIGEVQNYSNGSI